jgi:multiple sugar transport system ATP-binding protein
MADIRLVGVTKRYRNIEAVKDLNLNVKEGEFLAIVGPPGAGKSTTLRLVAGIDKPDQGEIYIGGKLVNNVPLQERNVAMVFESLALYPNKTGFENIAFPLRVQKKPDSEIKRRVDEVADLLHISHILQRKPATYSGGERQRVAIGRAIIKQSQVLLLDEPLSQVDALIRTEMRAELKRLQRELGQTLIYTTHDQVEGMAMADRMAVMNNGILQQCDVPETVYNNPVNVFTAGHIGSPSMNFFDCQFREEGGRAFLDTGSFTYELPGLRGKVAGQKSDLVLGVRPEDILISKKENAGSVAAEVYTIEPLGLKTIVDLRIGERVFKATVAPSFDVQFKEKVWITFARDKIHVFDKSTGHAYI